MGFAKNALIYQWKRFRFTSQNAPALPVKTLCLYHQECNIFTTPERSDDKNILLKEHVTQQYLRAKILTDLPQFKPIGLS